MKSCFKCGERKPIDDFYRHPMMRDGHLNKCKDCTRTDVRTNRRANVEYYREYDRQRWYSDSSRRESVRARERRLRQSDPEGYRAITRESSRRSYRKYPERKRASVTVRRAILRGDLVKAPCEVCGDVRSEAHHDDYSKPLVVRWLCETHHGRADHDRRRRERAASGGQ